MPTYIRSHQTSPSGAMSLDQPTDFVKHQTVTRDAFLGGRLTVSQPRNGFRAGLDSVLLGAAVPAGVRDLLDLGAGVGTAGLVAMALASGLKADLAERDEANCALAEVNVAENGFLGRAKVLRADVAAPASARRDAGIGDNAYDVVIANPPFFAEGRGTQAADRRRADARHMESTSLDLWVRCAAASARAGGTAIMIYPAQGLAELLEAFAGRFGAITILPLAPRPGMAASRVLIRGLKGSRAPLTLLSARPMHGEEGNGFLPAFDTIFRGGGALDW